MQERLVLQKFDFGVQSVSNNASYGLILLADASKFD